MLSKEFEKLQEENNNLRMNLALSISNLKPKEQNKILKTINKLINVEIEQEKLCSQ